VKKGKELFNQLNISEIIISGNRSVIVDNVRNVIEYNSDIIRLETPKNQIVIRGDELALINMTQDKVSVSGNIISTEFV